MWDLFKISRVNFGFYLIRNSNWYHVEIHMYCHFFHYESLKRETVKIFIRELELLELVETWRPFSHAKHKMDWIQVEFFELNWSYPGRQSGPISTQGLVVGKRWLLNRYVYSLRISVQFLNSLSTYHVLCWRLFIF